jgi:hypothetical protein
LESGTYGPPLPMEGERCGASRGYFASHWLGGQECPPSLLDAWHPFTVWLGWLQRFGSRRRVLPPILDPIGFDGWRCSRRPPCRAGAESGWNPPGRGDRQGWRRPTLVRLANEGRKMGSFARCFCFPLAARQECRASLFWDFAFFATVALFPVDVGGVHAAEVAQGGLRRAGFEQKMVARDLVVVWQAEVAVLHPSDQDGFVLGEFEGAGGAVGVLDLVVDGSGHAEVLLVLRMRREIVNLGGEVWWRDASMAVCGETPQALFAA